ncbi:MAG: DNA oxidative demethylase AlkB [Cellvibrio sp.]
MNLDLFTDNTTQPCELICAGANLLRGFALQYEADLLRDINQIISIKPPRTMYTPSGLPMSVITTSCGDVGWVSDARGYRYSKRDIHSQQDWPTMPESFLKLAQHAAKTTGFLNFSPDSCLINCYNVGAKMSLHQDKDEKDFSQPIVSVSLGLPATFLLGGLLRTDKTTKVYLTHGDVVVWGASARLFFHGVLPVKTGHHPLLGNQRINLTFRKAL